MQNTETINKVHNTELEILNAVHKFCLEHNIKYSLTYGTLIGAVRHKGFIPWDDDIDIMMPRADYNRFLTLWSQHHPDGFILQNSSTDSDYINNFTKIRKDNTTFLQSENEKNKKYHKGIFIDIFPFERVAPNKFSALIQYFACAVNLLYSRGFLSGNSGIIGLTEKILLKTNIANYSKRRDLSQKIVSHWQNKDNCYLFSPCVIEYCKKYFDADLFDEIIQLEFNGNSYNCIKNFDKFLSTCYGDYMQLPPEDERVWKHSPILLDFDHNFEDIDNV